MTSPKPILAFLAIGIMLPAGVWFGVVRPMDQRRLEMEKDTAAKQASIAAFHQSMASVQDGSAKTQALCAAVADFEAKLPADGQIDEVLEDISRMAQANSLQTKTVKTPAVQRSAGYSEQTMDLSLSGDFAGFYQFLLNLEDAKHVMRIKKMHLTRLGDHDGEMQADVTLSVYSGPKQDSM